MNNAILINTVLPNLLQSTIIVTSQIMALKIVDKIKLYKINKYENAIITEFPYQEKPIEETKKEINREKIKELLPYIEKLQAYTSEDNLKTAYSNLKTINIKHKPLILLRGLGGSYSPKENRIDYALKNFLGHEFLHLCSSHHGPSEDGWQSGFMQIKGIKEIGRGINEGYTELLASRIYNKNGKVKTYKKEVKIVQLLEFFFDNPKEMENYYFNHNLPGFIHHMEHFALKQEVTKMLLDIDRLERNSLVWGMPFSTMEFIKIQLKLYDWFKRKNQNPIKLRQFEQIICENPIVSMTVNKQKIKLQKKHQNLRKNHNSQGIIQESMPPKKEKFTVVQTNSLSDKEKNYMTKDQEQNQASRKEFLDYLSSYQGYSFKEICSNVLQMPEENINIISATRLYCMIIGIDFPKDRKSLYTLSRQVQTLILPENEKTGLDYRVQNQLQRKINLILEKEEKEESYRRVV